MESTSTPTTMEAQPKSVEAVSPPSQKRPRAKQACEPCRLRKRRCDGEMPCNMCAKFDYKCYFEKHGRKRSKIVEKDAQENNRAEKSPAFDHGTTTPVVQQDIILDRAGPEELSKLKFMEANSGIAFTRLLGMRLDTSAGPKLFTFGWNTGSMTRNFPITRSITDIISLDTMLNMGRVYFEKIDVLYSILDKTWVLEQILIRYSKSEQIEHCPDTIFAGIAALGSIFSPGVIDDLRPVLVDAAKVALESTSTLNPPMLHDVQAWQLRVIYLRFAGQYVLSELVMGNADIFSPHSCWMASNTTMHLVECLGLHQESSSSVIYAAPKGGKDDADTRRRTFWVSRLFNTWTSFEYGRSRIGLRGITCPVPEPREGDLTRDYINLYSISCCLDPELLDKPGQWEEFLTQIEGFESRHDCITMSKANLALAAYRRLRLANPNLPAEIINRIVGIVNQGLQAARSLAVRKQPWWHVANIPFQSICVYLAIDTKEALSGIPAAMRLLEFVTMQFATPSMKECLKTARFLVRLSKRKKDEDSVVLGESLLKDVSESDPRPENLQTSIPHPPNGVNHSTEENPSTTTSEDWSLDFLNDYEFNWECFLRQDIPAFHNLAPDGMM